jgi:hypothetical protein
MFWRNIAMSTARTADYEQILTIVRSWPPAQRFTLIQEILTTLAPAEPSERVPQHTLDQARGLLVSGRPAPSDEEIARWLDERRSERYGVWG